MGKQSDFVEAAFRAGAEWAVGNQYVGAGWRGAFRRWIKRREAERSRQAWEDEFASRDTWIGSAAERLRQIREQQRRTETTREVTAVMVSRGEPVDESGCATCGAPATETYECESGLEYLCSKCAARMFG